MPLHAYPAVFMRGGTSRAIMFHAKDLPPREEWDRFSSPRWAVRTRTDGS